MTSKFSAMMAIFFFVAGMPAQGGDTLLVATKGQIMECADLNGDGAVDCRPVWGEKGGPTTEFTTVAQVGRKFYLGSENKLWMMPDDDMNSYYEQDHNVVFPGVRTPMAIMPRRDGVVWLGGDGSIVRADILGGVISIPSEDQYQIRRGPQGCHQFAWHYPTQSLLCIGETYGPYAKSGLWVVPTMSFTGELNWDGSQFFPAPRGASLRGLVSDREGVYALGMSEQYYDERTVPSRLYRVVLRRSGFGEFEASYEPIIDVATDLDVAQPLAIGEKGLYLVVARDSYSSIYGVYLIDRDGRNHSFFVSLAERPSVIFARPD